MRGTKFLGAFNTSIAAELQRRIRSDVPASHTAIASTMHSAGYAAWRQRHPMAAVLPNKTRITLVVDIYTRVVTGFYPALDYPSTLRAGVCVAQSVFEKGAWLAEHGIDIPWPVARLPRAVHVDNAREFHSAAFTRALEDFGVGCHARPPSTGHVGKYRGGWANLNSPISGFPA